MISGFERCYSGVCAQDGYLFYSSLFSPNRIFWDEKYNSRLTVVYFAWKALQYKSNVNGDELCSHMW